LLLMLLLLLLLLMLMRGVLRLHCGTGGGSERLGDIMPGPFLSRGDLLRFAIIHFPPFKFVTPSVCF
jgi:hypothetical protein